MFSEGWITLLQDCWSAAKLGNPLSPGEEGSATELCQENQRSSHDDLLHPLGRDLKMQKSELPFVEAFGGFDDLCLEANLKNEGQVWHASKNQLSPHINSDDVVISSMKAGGDGWFSLKNLMDCAALNVV